MNKETGPTHTDPQVLGAPPTGTRAVPRLRSALRWASFAQIVRQGVQVLTILVLARTLTPADFGLVTVASVVVGFLALFKDLSVGSAVIQKGRASQAWLSTIFWIAIAIATALSAIVIATAPSIGEVLDQPALTDLLRVLAVSFVLTGIGIVHQAILERDLRYRLVAGAELTAVIAGSVVAIMLAITGAGVWSLVGQVLVVSGTTTVVLWAVSPWRPSLMFQPRAALAGGSFGVGLTTYNLINYVARNADYLFIGRALGATELGYYTLAYRLMLFPLQIVTSVVNRIMFPGLSRLRDQPQEAAALYLQGVAAVGFAAFPIALGLAAVAPRLIPVALGPGWGSAVPVAVLLSVVGLLQSIGASVGPVFLARGAIRAMVIWGFASTALVVVGFVVGLRGGIVGVAAAYLAVSAGLLYPSFLLALRPLGVQVRAIVAVVWRSMLSALIMTGVVVAIGVAAAGQSSDVLVLVVEIALGTGVYLAVSSVLNHRQMHLIVGRVLRG